MSLVCLFSMVIATRNNVKSEQLQKKNEEYLHDIKKINTLQSIQAHATDTKRETRRKRKANKILARAKRKLK